MEKDPYAKVADRYDRITGSPTLPFRRRGMAMLPPRDGIAVLDMACGTGAQLALYARPGCTLAGVDLSPSMLEAARRKLGPSADLRCEDGTATSFAAGSFDIVMAAFALHEMPAAARPRVISEMRRVARPGGSILLLDFHNGPYPFPRGWLYKALVLWMEIGAGREHFHNYRDFMAHRCLDALVEGAGMTARHRFVSEVGVVALYVLAA
jgi:ubiquinone/menaquinone biosynthesis C-methylase UbiE